MKTLSDKQRIEFEKLWEDDENRTVKNIRQSCHKKLLWKPRQRRYSFDSACYSLAEHFLSDYENVTEQNKKNLAQNIQDACEDFLDTFEEGK